MSKHYIVQLWRSARYVDLFRIALKHGEYTHLNAAVAYATISGVRTLDRTLRHELGDQWDRLEKRWLVGIDWCRSDPPALDQLAALQKSTVKIPSGEKLVGRIGCVPNIPYHPKAYFLYGMRYAAIICGSGNLSASGLTKGCECGSVLTFEFSRRSTPDQSEFTQLLQWFRAAWRNADSYAQLDARYKTRCKERIQQEKFIPTEDDAQPEQTLHRGRVLSPTQIRQLRTYDNFWIEGGALGANLGRGLPGSQLDMTRYTRVFFGAQPADVRLNTIIDHLTLIWDDVAYPDRTLKFGNNGMDKLNIPPAGDRGPMFYSNKTLLFTRLGGGRFRFTVGGNAERNDWLRRSKRIQANYALPGGRQWGLF